MSKLVQRSLENVSEKESKEGIILGSYVPPSLLEAIEKAQDELGENTKEFITNSYLDRIRKAHNGGDKSE